MNDEPNRFARPADEHAAPPATSVPAQDAYPATTEGALGRNAPRRRRSIALLRLLGADCPSCRGFGCDVCAGTGLS